MVRVPSRKRCIWTIVLLILLGLIFIWLKDEATTQVLQPHLSEEVNGGRANPSIITRQRQETVHNISKPLYMPIQEQNGNTQDTQVNDEVSHKSEIPTSENSEQINMNKHYLVPNIVHYVRLHKTARQFQFTELVSVMSSLKVQQADNVMIHCNHRPVGRWWLEVELKYPHVKVNLIDIPLHNNKSFASIQHAVDYTKLRVLKEYGGIVMETDVYFLTRVDSLRVYNMTMGATRPSRVTMAFIMANQHSQFLRILLDAWRNDYKPDVWDYNSAVLPYRYYLRQQQLVHMEPEALSLADWRHKDLLYTVNGYFTRWKQLYVLHLMFHDGEERIYNPDYINSMRNIIGQVLRLAYYGSSDERDPFAPHNMYSKNGTLLAK